jgi:hypothetical protein
MIECDSQAERKIPRMAQPSVTQQRSQPSISGDQALRIAEADAVAAYGDLSRYRIVLALEPDGWHVDYELKNKKALGGGPHYRIDPVSGTILWKRYEQ